jgi:RNA recognition motif-containing protein
MRDQATGRARGFAFVEMVNDEDAQKAIEEFHQYEYDGRALVVNEARPKESGGFGGGGAGHETRGAPWSRRSRDWSTAARPRPVGRRRFSIIRP